MEIPATSECFAPVIMQYNAETDLVEVRLRRMTDAGVDLSTLRAGITTTLRETGSTDRITQISGDSRLTVEVQGDTILVKWLIGLNTTINPGVVEFMIDFQDADNRVVCRDVRRYIKIDPAISDEDIPALYPSMLAQWENRMNALEQAATETLENAKSEADRAATAADRSEGIREDITARQGQIKEMQEDVATDRVATEAAQKDVAKRQAEINTAHEDIKTKTAAVLQAAEQVNSDKQAVDQATTEFVATVADANDAINNKVDSAKTEISAMVSSAQQAETAAAQSAQEAQGYRDEIAKKIDWLGPLALGVRFQGGKNPGERIYDAVGLVAGVGTDTETAVNDFDKIEPWKTLYKSKSCGYFDSRGNWVVNAYRGQPGYTTDGSNGEVFAHIMPCYYLDDVDGESGIAAVSMYPIPGYTYWPGGWVACYPMATVGGKATSRSGVFGDACSLDTAIASARTLGCNYTVSTVAEKNILRVLMLVEFATRSLQTVMRGATAMAYSTSDTAVVAESNTNRIIVSSDIANRYVVGQTIGIGTTLRGNEVANNRIVTAIEDYSSGNKAIVFGGNPVDIKVGHIVYSLAWINGSCDGVLSSSGSPVSNNNEKYNCTYRGIEAPYGNALEWISDVLFQRVGSGTDSDPYQYDIYHLPDATKYDSGRITEDYVKVNYQLPTSNGCVMRLGYDSRYPALRLPIEVGASTATYYADYYYYPAATVGAAAVGGNWSAGSYAGPAYWNCSYGPSTAYASRWARLSYQPPSPQAQIDNLREMISNLQTAALAAEIGGAK